MDLVSNSAIEARRSAESAAAAVHAAATRAAEDQAAAANEAADRAAAAYRPCDSNPTNVHLVLLLTTCFLTYSSTMNVSPSRLEPSGRNPACHGLDSQALSGMAGLATPTTSTQTHSRRDAPYHLPLTSGYILPLTTYRATLYKFCSSPTDMPYTLPLATCHLPLATFP